MASVSCIYGLGSPIDYQEMVISLRPGMEKDRDEVIRKLIDIQYTRNDMDFHRGTFRVRGDVLEIFPAYSDSAAYRVEFFGDEIDRIVEIDTLTGEAKLQLNHIAIFPASHYVVPKEKMQLATENILEELKERVAFFKSEDKLLEAQRISERTNFDVEMMRETGFCSGIENYSRHLTFGKPGEPPWTLIDYFPDDFLIIVDESHITLPQVRGMYAGAAAPILFQHLQQDPGSLLPHLLLVKAHRGQPRFHHAASPTVANACKTHILPHMPSCFPQGTHGTKGHRVSHANHTVQIRAAHQQFLHTALALLHGKGVAADAGHLFAVQSGSVQRILHALTALHAGGIVPLCTANINDPSAAMVQHPLGKFPGCSAVVVVHAGHILKTLACYHHRHTAVFQRLRQLRGIIAAQQDDARHVVALHGSQIAQFPLGIQLGVSQQQQIVLCIQLTGNACRDLPHRLGADAGSDHPHLIHFSGAQSLGGGIRAVAGLFHYLVDDSPLLFAQLYLPSYLVSPPQKTKLANRTK